MYFSPSSRGVIRFFFWYARRRKVPEGGRTRPVERRRRARNETNRTRREESRRGLRPSRSSRAPSRRVSTFVSLVVFFLLFTTKRWDIFWIKKKLTTDDFDETTKTLFGVNPFFFPNNTIEPGASSASNNRREKFHVSAMSVKKNTLKNYEGMVLLRPDVEDSIKQVQLDKLRTLVARDEGSSFEVTERGLQNNMYNIKGYPDAYQVQLDISCMPATIKEMESVMAKPEIGEEEVFLRSTFFRLNR